MWPFDLRKKIKSDVRDVISAHELWLMPEFDSLRKEMRSGFASIRDEVRALTTKGPYPDLPSGPSVVGRFVNDGAPSLFDHLREKGASVEDALKETMRFYPSWDGKSVK